MNQQTAGFLFLASHQILYQHASHQCNNDSRKKEHVHKSDHDIDSLTVTKQVNDIEPLVHKIRIITRLPNRAPERLNEKMFKDSRGAFVIQYVRVKQ